jgi:hypothetical protein
MSKIYKDQTYLRIKITTGVDISSAQETKIYYADPSNDIGSVTAIVDDETTGVVYYDLLPDTGIELNQIGEWKFWAFIKFWDGRIARGESFSVIIYDNTK